MKIQIFGTGCSKCKQLEENTRNALEEAGKKAEIEKVTEMKKIIDAGIFATPAITVDGKIVSSGEIPTKEEIMKFLK